MPKTTPLYNSTLLMCVSFHSFICVVVTCMYRCQVDEKTGRLTGGFKPYALSGFLRRSVSLMHVKIIYNYYTMIIK